MASRPGLQKIQETHPDIYMTVGAVDDLVDNVMVPGLGDAGDRLYGTIPVVTEEPPPANKRQREE